MQVFTHNCVIAGISDSDMRHQRWWRTGQGQLPLLGNAALKVTYLLKVICLTQAKP